MCRRNIALVKQIVLALLVALGTGSEAAEPTAQIYDVRSFGAVGDGEHDDGPAFRRAIETARAAPGEATIVVPAGLYRIGTVEHAKASVSLASADGRRRGGRRLVAHLIIQNTRALTIAGEPGTRLLMGDPDETGLVVMGSTNVTLRNFAIDYDPLPFTQGKVVATSPLTGTFDLQIAPGYGDPVGQMYQDKDAIWRAVFFDPSTRRYDFSIPDYRIISAKWVNQRTWRLQVVNRARALARLELGRLAAVMGRHSGKPAVRLFHSRDVLIDGVTIYSAPGGAFNLRGADNATLRRCGVATPEGGNRLLSANADAVHVKHSRHGPRIEFCRFTRQGDDAINIGTALASVMAQETAKTLIFDVLPKNARPGDQLQFIESRSGEVLGERRIAGLEATQWHGDRAVRVHLNAPFKVPYTAETMGLQRIRRGPPIKRSQLERQIPVLAVDLDVAGKGTLIRNNMIGNHRARGILIRGSNATIANNTFEHLAGPAIIAGFDLNFTEGPGVENLTIRNNTFRDIALTNILVANTGLGDYRLLDGVGASRNIIIQDNRFWGAGTKAWRNTDGLGRYVTINGAESVTISGNQFDNAARSAHGPQASILIRRVRDARVRQNGNATVVESARGIIRK